MPSPFCRYHAYAVTVYGICTPLPHAFTVSHYSVCHFCTPLHSGNYYRMQLQYVFITVWHYRILVNIRRYQMPLPYPITICLNTMPLKYAFTVCQNNMPLPKAITVCHNSMLLLPYDNTKCHYSMPLRTHQKKPYKEISDEYWNVLVNSRINRDLKGMPPYQ